MDPVNYTALQTPINLAQDFSQGLQVAGQYQQIKQIGEERQLAIQKQQVAQAQQQAYQADIGGYMKNPTAEGAAGLIAKYPQQAAALKSSWDGFNDKQKEDELGVATQAYAAANAGRDDIVQNLLQQRIDAKKNSGQDASAEQQLLDIQAKDPSQIKAALGIKLATVMGPDKFAATYGTLNDQSRQDTKAPLENAKLAADASKAGTDANVAAATFVPQVQEAGLKNQKIRSDIQNQADQLGLARDKLTTETQLAMQESRLKYGQLPEAVMGKVDAATGEAVASQQSATQLSSLADKIDANAASLGSGAGAKVDQWWSKTFGTNNELNRIRSEYDRIVTPSAMAAYKKVASGSTSDKDIDTAMVGVPSSTASPETMASFLRGTAKLQVYNSVSKNAESEWLGSNKFLGKSTSDMTIDGVQVPKGTTYKEFADQYIQKKVGEQLGAMTLKQVQGRSYMRYAGPAAPQGTY